MRWRNFKRRFGIAAPRMAVRPRRPWYGHLLIVLVGCALALAIAWWAFHMNLVEHNRRLHALAVTIEQQQSRLAGQHDDIAALQRQLADAGRAAKLERSAAEGLKQQIRALSGENIELKKDLAFFQTLMPASGKAGLTINRLQIVHDATPGEYRYQLLLLQSGLHDKVFDGTVRFVINIEKDGTAAVVNWPQSGDPAPALHVNFKFYQRVEGTFQVAPQARVKSVEVQVYEAGGKSPKLTQSVKVS
jgi:type II secretory pathway component PulM